MQPITVILPVNRFYVIVQLSTQLHHSKRTVGDSDVQQGQILLANYHFMCYDSIATYGVSISIMMVASFFDLSTVQTPIWHKAIPCLQSGFSQDLITICNKSKISFFKTFPSPIFKKWQFINSKFFRGYSLPREVSKKTSRILKNKHQPSILNV